MNTLRLLAGALLALSLAAQTRTVPLASTQGIKLVGASAQTTTYKGKPALRVTFEAGGEGGSLAILPGSDFQDGVIEYEFAGDVKPGSPPAFRGFTGLAFRVSPDGAKYECFYQRPLNARSQDQEQRNHSVQYVSTPGFPWQKLRGETPSRYEVYADMARGEWTQVKIEVKGDKARIYLNGASQPAMIVNDLKQGVSRGALALWVGPGTVAHFANLKMTP
jgi:hypothetical protein